MGLIQTLGPRAKQPIEHMLIVFECRVDVWQFGPAVEMLKLIEAAQQTSVWAHAAYTLLGATFSYFEMVGKILNPASSVRRTSGPDFNVGFCDVYPAFAPGQAPTDYRSVMVSRTAKPRRTSQSVARAGQVPMSESCTRRRPYP